MPNRRALDYCNKGFYLSNNVPAGEPPSITEWCYECPDGTYADKGNRDRQCKICRACLSTENQYPYKLCSTTADAQCRCREGYTEVLGTCKGTGDHTDDARFASTSESKSTESETNLYNRENNTTVNYLNSSLSTLPTAQLVDNDYDSQSNKMPVLQSVSPVAFYIGNTAVTSDTLSVTLVLITLIATLVAVVIILSRRLKAARRKSQFDMHVPRDQHTYEEPDFTLPSASSSSIGNTTILRANAMQVLTDHDGRRSCAPMQLLDRRTVQVDDYLLPCATVASPATNFRKESRAAVIHDSSESTVGGLRQVVWIGKDLAPDLVGELNQDRSLFDVSKLYMVSRPDFYSHAIRISTTFKSVGPALSLSSEGVNFVSKRSTKYSGILYSQPQRLLPEYDIALDEAHNGLIDGGYLYNTRICASAGCVSSIVESTVDSGSLVHGFESLPSCLLRKELSGYRESVTDKEEIGLLDGGYIYQSHSS